MAPIFDIPSLSFPDLRRVDVAVRTDTPTSSTLARYKAVDGLPPAPYRIFNGSQLQSLVLHSDEAALSAKVAASLAASTAAQETALLRSGLTAASLPPGAAIKAPATQAVSPMNTKKLSVSLSLDDVRANASFHDVSPPSDSVCAMAMSYEILPYPR